MGRKAGGNNGESFSPATARSNFHGSSFQSLFETSFILGSQGVSIRPIRLLGVLLGGDICMAFAERAVERAVLLFHVSGLMIDMGRDLLCDDRT